MKNQTYLMQWIVAGLLSGEIVGTLQFGARITIIDSSSDCVTIGGRAASLFRDS